MAGASRVRSAGDGTNGGAHDALFAGTRHATGRPSAPARCAIDVRAKAPWLFAELEPQATDDAARAARSRGFRIAKGRFDGCELSTPGDLAFLVLEGHLCRRVSLGRGAATQIVGPGDLSPPGITLPESPDTVEWLALSSSVVMIIDDDWLRAMSPWPELTVGISERFAESLAHAARAHAVRECAVVEDRLLLTLTYLAARWGEPTSEGRLVAVAGLTHEVLAALTGARRATITSAMTRLARRGIVKRSADRRWVLLDNGEHNGVNSMVMTSLSPTAQPRRSTPWSRAPS